MLGYFLILAPVEGLVLQVEPSERIGAKDEVVSSVDVADLGQAGVLRDEATRRALVPSQANVLSQVPVFREARDVDDLSQETGGDDRAKALDGDDRVGDWVNGVSDLLVEPLHQALDEVDVVPDGSKREGDHLIQLEFDGVGRAQGSLDGSCGSIRVIETSSTAASNDAGELMVGEVAQLGSGELGEEVDTGGAKDIGEGLDPLPVAALEEGDGLETHLLAGEGARKPVAIASETAETLPEVVRDVGEGQLAEAQPSGDVVGIPLIILLSTEIKTLFELGDELGIEADQLGLEGLQERVGGQEAMEGQPQHPRGLPGDLDMGVAQAGCSLSNGHHRCLGARPVVGHAEALDHLLATGLVDAP